MGKKTLPNNDRQLAEAHVRWYMDRMRKQFSAWAEITEQLLIDNFIHGMKHARQEQGKKSESDD